VSSGDFAPSTPISTPSAQQLSVDALRKQRSRTNIALHLEQTKKKAKAARNLIPHSPTKKAQEKLRVKRRNWSENMGVRMVAAACSEQMKTHLQDLGQMPTRHELDANKGNQQTLNKDVFFEALTLRMNDPDFLGELPFHDDHLDGKDGKPGIFPHRGMWTVPQVRQNFSKLEALHAKALQHYNRSGNQNGGCFCGCDLEGFYASSGYVADKHSGAVWEGKVQSNTAIHPPANVAVYAWYATGLYDPLFADKGTKLLKADCRFSGSVDGVRSAQPTAPDEAAAQKGKDPARKTSDKSTTDLKKTQRLLKKKVKDKKMEEDRHHRVKLSKAATFLPMAHSKKATVTEQLVAGLQNALGVPAVNATTKCSQELDNLQKHLSVLLKIHESGQKLLRDATDDEDKGWAQQQQRVSRVTFSAQNESIAACTTTLEQLLQQEDTVAEKNHQKKRAVSGKGKQRKDDSEDEDGKQSKDDSEDEDASPVKRRKKSQDDSEHEDNVDSESGSESVTVVSDEEEEEEEEGLW
jgi:hypothetical protein